MAPTFRRLKYYYFHRENGPFWCIPVQIDDVISLKLGGLQAFLNKDLGNFNHLDLTPSESSK